MSATTATVPCGHPAVCGVDRHPLGSVAILNCGIRRVADRRPFALQLAAR